MQGEFQQVEASHEPVSNGRDGREQNKKCQHERHHAARRLDTNEQDKVLQG